MLLKTPNLCADPQRGRCDADFADFFSHLRTLRNLRMISDGEQAVTSNVVTANA